MYVDTIDFKTDLCKLIRFSLKRSHLVNHYYPTPQICDDTNQAKGFALIAGTAVLGRILVSKSHDHLSPTPFHFCTHHHRCRSLLISPPNFQPYLLPFMSLWIIWSYLHVCDITGFSHWRIPSSSS